jgi:putative Mg2+ transporter-C (MgtC) family protein
VELNDAHLEMLLRLTAALFSGAFIGYERSFHGRPAGLRTHVLVCLASAVLMLVTVYEDHWVRTAAMETRLDPTRMAQGIMTGIGFLGAGVIVKEGINVRGLTTAASIWITAGIGVLAGVGLYVPMVASVLLTLLVLSVFRWVETRVPTQAYYFFDVKYAREGNLSEEAMRELLGKLSARRRLGRTHPAPQHDAADHGPHRGLAPGTVSRGKPDRARVQALAHRGLIPLSHPRA